MNFTWPLFNSNNLSQKAVLFHFKMAESKSPLGSSLCRTIWDVFCSCDKTLKMGKMVYFKLLAKNICLNQNKKSQLVRNSARFFLTGNQNVIRFTVFSVSKPYLSCDLTSGMKYDVVMLRCRLRVVSCID